MRRRIIDLDNEKCLNKLMVEHNIELAEIKTKTQDLVYVPRAKCYDCKEPYNTECPNFKRFE